VSKKSSSYGVSNYVRDKPRKRPRRHTKSISKAKPKKSKYRGQGR
tara:strand:+ start:1033 stop:1167 length:135 start_codon:yes stop_codon:yes gene_type:complete